MLDGIEFLIRMESHNAERYAKGGKLKTLFNAFKEKIWANTVMKFGNHHLCDHKKDYKVFHHLNLVS